MTIRTKIFAGFLILVIMLIIAGAISIIELTSIGTSVEQLLEDNYKSINAAKAMVEAIEREDSGILMLMLGHWENGRRTLQMGDSAFMHHLEIARNNITIAREDEVIEAISRDYQAYKSAWEKPIVGTSKEGDLNWYFDNLHQQFLKVKASLKQLMDLNDQTMYRTASELRNRAKKTVMPAIVAMISALVFALIFNFFLNLYIVKPIRQMINSIRSYINGRPYREVKTNTNDEISELAANIQDLVNNTRRDP